MFELIFYLNISKQSESRLNVDIIAKFNRKTQFFVRNLLFVFIV